jgi:hypothetical protein
MQVGDLVEIFADNSYGGIGLVIENREMYILVKGSDQRLLWYTRRELIPLRSCEEIGAWL